MFDKSMNDAFVKVDPIHNTSHMSQLFYDLTREFFNDITFGDQTYLNVYLKRSSKLYNKKDFLDSLRGFVMDPEPNWEDYTEEWNLETGDLYLIKMREENARLGNYTHKNIYCFMPKLIEECAPLYDTVEDKIGDCRNNMWFSYMEDECIMEWHTDGDTGFRYHHVLKNNPEVPAICTDQGPIMCEPGEAFILNTVRPHMVPYTDTKRLHLICSINGQQSTGEGHNNQWLEDGSFDWSDWQNENGY